VLTCPRCLARARADAAVKAEAARALYGKVTVEEFSSLSATLRTPDPKDFRTWREEWFFSGAEKGTVKVEYGGSCDVCRLSLSFDEEHPIPDVSDGAPLPRRHKAGRICWCNAAHGLDEALALNGFTELT
jgi:hypothetical protein